MLYLDWLGPSNQRKYTQRRIGNIQGLLASSSSLGSSKGFYAIASLAIFYFHENFGESMVLYLAEVCDEYLFGPAKTRGLGQVTDKKTKKKNKKDKKMGITRPFLTAG